MSDCAAPQNSQFCNELSNVLQRHSGLDPESSNFSGVPLDSGFRQSDKGSLTSRYEPKWL
jgi:hypothetical protein